MSSFPQILLKKFALQSPSFVKILLATFDSVRSREKIPSEKLGRFDFTFPLQMCLGAPSEKKRGHCSGYSVLTPRALPPHSARHRGHTLKTFEDAGNGLFLHVLVGHLLLFLLSVRNDSFGAKGWSFLTSIILGLGNSFSPTLTATFERCGLVV